MDADDDDEKFSGKGSLVAPRNKRRKTSSTKGRASSAKLSIGTFFFFSVSYDMFDLSKIPQPHLLHYKMTPIVFPSKPIATPRTIPS